MIRRREFLVRSLVGVAGYAGLKPCAAALLDRSSRPLSFYHVHTGETLKIVYRDDGEIVAGALGEIEHFLRDFRTEQEHAIDVALLDKLQALYDVFDRRGHFEVISGYRSPHTNEALRRSTTGVAKASLHLSGRAIDIRLTSAATDKLRDAAIRLQNGGVGYYAASNFVHVDTGPFRTW